MLVDRFREHKLEVALSVIGMVFATFGVLSPVAGAFFQEAIDVAVILNALRALGAGKVPG